MAIDHKKDLITAIAFFLFGIIVYIAAGNLPMKKIGGDMGSSFLPEFIAVIMMGLSGILFVKTAKKIKKDKAINNVLQETEQDKQQLTHGFAGNKAVVVSFINLVIFVVLFKPVGFILSGFLFMIIQMGIMTEDSKITKRKVVIWSGISVIVVIFVYVIFYEVFSMPLPLGLLDFSE